MKNQFDVQFARVAELETMEQERNDEIAVLETKVAVLSHENNGLKRFLRSFFSMAMQRDAMRLSLSPELYLIVQEVVGDIVPVDVVRQPAAVVSDNMV